MRYNGVGLHQRRCHPELPDLVMDDETFKKELLSRLDQIIDLLSSSLPEACLEERETDAVPGWKDTAEPAAVPSEPPYLIDDEMRDDYDVAVQRWKQAKTTG